MVVLPQPIRRPAPAFSAREVSETPSTALTWPTVRLPGNRAGSGKGGAGARGSLSSQTHRAQGVKPPSVMLCPRNCAPRGLLVKQMSAAPCPPPQSLQPGDSSRR